MRVNHRLLRGASYRSISASSNRRCISATLVVPADDRIRPRRTTTTTHSYRPPLVPFFPPHHPRAMRQPRRSSRPIVPVNIVHHPVLTTAPATTASSAAWSNPPPLIPPPSDVALIVIDGIVVVVVDERRGRLRRKDERVLVMTIPSPLRCRIVCGGGIRTAMLVAVAFASLPSMLRPSSPPAAIDVARRIVGNAISRRRRRHCCSTARQRPTTLHGVAARRLVNDRRLCFPPSSRKVAGRAGKDGSRAPLCSGPSAGRRFARGHQPWQRRGGGPWQRPRLGRVRGRQRWHDAAPKGGSRSGNKPREAREILVEGGVLVNRGTAPPRPRRERTPPTHPMKEA